MVFAHFIEEEMKPKMFRDLPKGSRPLSGPNQAMSQVSRLLIQIPTFHL